MGGAACLSSTVCSYHDSPSLQYLDELSPEIFDSPRIQVGYIVHVVCVCVSVCVCVCVCECVCVCVSVCFISLTYCVIFPFSSFSFFFLSPLLS